MLLAPLLSVSSLAVSPLAHVAQTLTPLLSQTSSTLIPLPPILPLLRQSKSSIARSKVQNTSRSNYNFNVVQPIQQWNNAFDPNTVEYIQSEKGLKTVIANGKQSLPDRWASTDPTYYHSGNRSKGYYVQLTPIAKRTYSLSGTSSVLSVRKTRNSSANRGEFLRTDATRSVDIAPELYKPFAFGTNVYTTATLSHVRNSPVALDDNNAHIDDNGYDRTVDTFRESVASLITTTTPPTTDTIRTDASLSTNSSSQSNSVKTVVLILSLIVFVILTLFGIVRCLRATRRASRALALPIPLLSEDRTPLNAESEHPVPMLSVQSPGYAGMERLGVPARSSISSQSDDSRRMRVDAAMLSNASNIYHGDLLHCPHHVPLPDSEWIPDRDLQIRNPYQTEITRTYIKPPPNKTALDVPEHAYSMYPAVTSCNLNQRAVPSTKSSKSNPITKFFLRISSPKSPETSTRTSSSNSNNCNTAAASMAVSATQQTLSAAAQPHNHHHHHYHHHHHHHQHHHYELTPQANVVSLPANGASLTSSTISIQKSAAYSSAIAVSNQNTLASNTTLPPMLLVSSSSLSSSSTDSSTTATKSLPPSPSPDVNSAHI